MSNSKIDQTNDDSLSILNVLMIIAPFFIGLAPDGWALMAGAVIAIALIVTVLMNKRFIIQKDPSLLFLTILAITALITIFTGISSGDSFIGALRYLSVLLWALLTLQMPPQKREDALLYLPSVALLMLVVSAALFFFPDTRSFITNGNNRLAGFFQYANTFALFLLLGFAIYMEKMASQDSFIKQILYAIVFLTGILWTGSRLTLGLTALFMIFSFVKQKDLRRCYLVLFAATAAILVIILIIAGIAKNPFYRLIDVSGSTFYGRLIYYQDALKIIAKHPLGLGYKGYWLVQAACQSAPYSTLYVHNGYLQCMLDNGWLAGIALILLLIRMISKSERTGRLLAIMIAIHIFFDFDLSYLYIWWIVVLLIPWNQKDKEIHPASGIVTAGVFLAASLLLIPASFTSMFSQYEKSYHILPSSLSNEILYMSTEEDLDQQVSLAKNVLSRYPDCGLAYDVLANADEEKNDYVQMVADKRQGLLLQKYKEEEYDQYLQMLAEALKYFEETNNTESKEKCLSFLQEFPSIISDAQSNLNLLNQSTVDHMDFSIAENAKSLLKEYGLN